jgi:hypothetical protein
MTLLRVLAAFLVVVAVPVAAQSVAQAPGGSQIVAGVEST